MKFLDGGQAYSIASRHLSATFSPEMGGRLLELKYRDIVDIVVPMAPHRFNVLEWPRAGAYPLIPYHNRLANASVSVGEQAISLQAHPAAKPHTLHGPSQSRPWCAVKHETDRFAMEIDYEADPDWPWRFSAAQEFLVEDNVLTIRISVSNRDSTPMPAGFGWHPYFASTDEPVTDAVFHWPHGDDYLPHGSRAAITNRKQFEKRATSYLEEWNSTTIRLNGAHVLMTAESPFDFLVVHRGDPFHVCVEPVSHVANCWNLDVNPDDVGARVLQPGGVLTGQVKLTVNL